MSAVATQQKKRAHTMRITFNPAHILPLSPTRPYRSSFFSFSINLSLYPSFPSIRGPNGLQLQL